MRLASLLRVAAIATTLAFPAAAHAQYAMMVFGTGPAALCYEQVKAKRLNLSTL